MMGADERTTAHRQELVAMFLALILMTAMLAALAVTLGA
jgi:hypothetical protein